MQLAWRNYSEKHKTEVHLFNTLQSKPVLVGTNVIELTVGNSVQEEHIRKIKPELYGFLSKALQNTEIEINIKVAELKTNSNYKTDEQRFKDMASQNEALKELKLLFNLDFGN